MTWRDKSNTVIQKALIDFSDETDADKLFQKISRERYPFGPREQFPYKAWLSAIAKNKELYLSRTQQPKPQEVIDYKVGLFEEV